MNRSLPEEIAAALVAWVTGQLKVVALLTVLYALGFAWVGLRWWALLAILCGLCNLIPLFGSLLALCLAALAALFSGNDSTILIWTGLVWVVVQTLEGFWITPKILGRSLQVPPLWIFLGVLLGGAFFGFLGILLAAPLLAIALAVWRRRSPQSRPR
jgi:predicted PurR-regulated permease PerM